MEILPSEFPVLLTLLSRRMGEGAMGLTPMPPEGIMERMLQNASTREDLTLFRDLLRADSEGRSRAAGEDPAVTQAVEALDGISAPLLKRVEQALEVME